MRCARTRVLPDPAPATMSSGPPSWSTASRCWGLSPSSSSSASGARPPGADGPPSGPVPAAAASAHVGTPAALTRAAWALACVAASTCGSCRGSPMSRPSKRVLISGQPYVAGPTPPARRTAVDGTGGRDHHRGPGRPVAVAATGAAPPPAGRRGWSSGPGHGGDEGRAHDGPLEVVRSAADGTTVWAGGQDVDTLSKVASSGGARCGRGIPARVRSRRWWRASGVAATPHRHPSSWTAPGPVERSRATMTRPDAGRLAEVLPQPAPTAYRGGHGLAKGEVRGAGRPRRRRLRRAGLEPGAGVLRGPRRDQARPGELLPLGR